VIHKHLVSIGYMAGEEEAFAPDEKKVAAMAAAEGAPARHCPRCSSPSFVKLEGCDSCLSCGYSKCG
jgi:ribonucleoside-diphosphate reductase alpha chain